MLNGQTPSPQVLEGIISDMTLGDAVTEIAENALEAGATRLSFTVSNDNERLVIRDNGGGMTNEVLNMFVRLGGTTRRDSAGRAHQVGRYGVGFTALMRIAGHVVIESKSQGEPAHSMVLDRVRANE